MRHDTLRIGNSRIERGFLWNGGALRTLWLTDKRSGHTISSGGKGADFLISKAPVTEGRLTVDRLKSDGLHPDCLEAMVETQQGSLLVRRIYRVYPGTPAILCQTWLKGSMQLTCEARNENNADKSNIEDLKVSREAVGEPILDSFRPAGKHWHVRTVEFWDATDWNNNLVAERSFIPYRKSYSRGNILLARDEQQQGGFFLLKEAPCTSTQLYGQGKDFVTEQGSFMVVGLGIGSEDVNSDRWTRAYSVVMGIGDGTELSLLMNLHHYCKQERAMKTGQDDMIMMNTWGDRSQDAKIDEAFCLNELDCAHRLGITVFQLDDGWQTGRSPNSAQKGGSFTDIWARGDYWTPNKAKFPHGLDPIVKKARRLGIRVGLWYNPSVQNEFEDWEKDADAIIGLYRRYGITIFKIDGVQMPTKRAEERLRNLFDKVLCETNHQVIFNLDVTAGRRAGYNMFGEYGNIFLENRYTDWGNYYPYQTLRNLWQLSRYVPAKKLQVEFLNKWRNADKYPSGDRFAPSLYSLPYLFAITMAAQPLAWMEASSLPSEAYAETAPIIHGYNALQHELHSGIILPIGNEPDGVAWTGFQSLNNELSEVKSGSEGYLIVYRELSQSSEGQLRTWLPAGVRISTQRLLGEGSINTEVSQDGSISVTLPRPNSFGVFKYKVE